MMSLEKQLSEYGRLHEELFGPIAVEDIPNPFVEKREQSTFPRRAVALPRTTRRNRHAGPLWAGAAFIAVIAAAALYLALSDTGDPVADTPPPPTTVGPDVETMAQLEIIEAGVAAFYSGDAEGVATLFELSDTSDEELRQESADQAAIDDYVGLDCTEDTPWTFSCLIELRDALREAQIRVNRGVIRDFVLMLPGMDNILFGSFLAAEGRLEGYVDCIVGPLNDSCAAIRLENHAAFVEWTKPWDLASNRRQVFPLATLNAALEAWYGGDCFGAHYLAGAMFFKVEGGMFDNGYREGADALCPASANSSQTIEYESILEADVALEACEVGGGSSDGAEIGGYRVDLEGVTYSCEVHYSNVMNNAVGKSPSLTIREFRLMWHVGLVTGDSRRSPWYAEDVYPEDTELRESFKQFAEGGDLSDEYAAANCANERTPDCAHLIKDNLDEWAAWYRTNG